MLDNVKYLMLLKSVDKNIVLNEFDIALEKLNKLIRADYNPSVTYLKRGLLCKKLLMFTEAYSDFTYIIGHCSNKTAAYYERALLNFEMANFNEAIRDCDVILTMSPEKFDLKRVKFLSLTYSNQDAISCKYLLDIFYNNKYKTLQFLFNEIGN